eukprot:6746305-Prymnesium_polylepis.1
MKTDHDSRRDGPLASHAVWCGARATSLEQRGGGRWPRRVQRADHAGEGWKCRLQGSTHF